MKSSSWAKSPAQNRSTASFLLSLGKMLQAMHRWFEQEQKYGWHQKPSICPSRSPPCMNPRGIEQQILRYLAQWSVSQVKRLGFDSKLVDTLAMQRTLDRMGDKIR